MVEETVKCSVKLFCTSIALTWGVQTFPRRLRSIVGMTHFVGDHYFGFTESTAIVQNCCDVCQNSNPSSESVEKDSEINESVLRSALSSYVTSSDLKDEVSLECIEQLVCFPTLYLADEELTKDFQISSTVAKSLCSVMKQVIDLSLR